MISITCNLKERGIKDYHNVIIDEAKNIATFYIYNLSGKIIGYQTYNPNCRKIHIKKIPDDQHPIEEMRYFTRLVGRSGVWGLEYYCFNQDLWIVEGVFDCIKLLNQGLCAIATLQHDPKGLINWFSMLPNVKRVICDNDESGVGNKLAKYGDFSYTVPDPFKDLGDMSDGQVALFLNSISKEENEYRSNEASTVFPASRLGY